MNKPFLKVMGPDQARELLREFPRLGLRRVELHETLFRVLGEPVKAEEDLPLFDRSTMDGFAVRSSDTFGASESSPALASVTGEISMGEINSAKIGRGECARIWTGGALPKGSDAVVMVEHVENLDDSTIEILRAVAPFENVVRKGEDFKARETLLEVGHRLRPQDLGLLAAMGRTDITVYERPKVAIISSGDEIVPVNEDPPPGCMRDVNRYTLEAMIRTAHATPVWIGIAPDSLGELSALIDEGIRNADVVVVSGGSSMGARDLVIEAIRKHEDSEILLHGVSVSPGKPLILARADSRPVAGLPGHPVSAMVCFEQFIVPLVRHLEGEPTLAPFLTPTLQAVLGRNIPSKEGRTDFIRVRLHDIEKRLTAVPVPGKSGMISGMVRAHGTIRIEPDCEGLYKGDSVTVHLFSSWAGARIEKEHLFRHEAAGRSPGNLFESSRQEKLSRS
jgi:molybdopterin molybdotransferase